MLAKLDSTSNNINATLSDENRAALTSTLADIATVAHTIAARKDTIDAGIASAARTFENASRATAQVGPVIDRIGRSADAIEKMGNEVARTSASAGTTVDSVGADVKRFTAETLPELERLLGELSVLSTSLRRLTEQTERNPRGLLFGRRPVPEGPGESATGCIKAVKKPSIVATDTGSWPAVLRCWQSAPAVGCCQRQRRLRASIRSTVRGLNRGAWAHRSPHRP